MIVCRLQLAGLAALLSLASTASSSLRIVLR